MTSVINEIVVDCADPERVAEFWGAALGWDVQREGEYFWMSASGEPGDGGLILVFVPVPEPKTVKNRVHIDVSPRGCDQPEEVERLLGLGARHVDVGQGDDVPWVVLADPEGNEFCVLRRRVD
jgi:predicted enzyme related to lactoylglutathione lyase